MPAAPCVPCLAVGFCLMVRVAAVLSVSLAGVLGLLVQPMMGKLMLPSMGGGSGVWTSVSVFFQGMLVVGYLYAAVLQSLRPRLQVTIHYAIGLAGLALFLLPVSPPEGSPQSALLFLSRVLGASMMVVSSTSPLVQGWMSSSDPGGMARVYRLFAFSNLAAIAGLLLYPFAIERHLDIGSQVVLWGCVYGALMATLAPLALRGASSRPLGSMLVAWEWRWWVLPMLSTMLMLSTAARLTRDTAPVPFVWVVLLSLYLLSYALVFSVNWTQRLRAVAIAEAPIAAAAMMVLLSSATAHDGASLLLLAVSFFALCVFAHGEVVHVRPPSGGLPSFYVAMAVGGFAGGAAMLAMPYLLDIDIELMLLLSALASLAIGLGLLTVAPRAALASALAVFAVGASWTLWTSTSTLGRQESEVVTRGRTFFGSYSVEARSGHTVLVHNGTIHGAQSSEIGRQRDPTTYYSKDGPLGVAWLIALLDPSSPSRQKTGLSVGVMGLGSGTAAGYSDQGDRLVFFEIDAEIAEVMPEHFSFVPDARIRGADVEILVGDGRKLLESMPPQKFDILVVDAFSGDSVPAHLLSAEAFGEYSRHLAKDGILAVHVSNRMIDVPSVARGGASSVGLDHETLMGGGGTLSVKSVWVLASPSEARMRAVRASGLSVPPAESSREVVWTDRYSDIVSVLK